MDISVIRAEKTTTANGIMYGEDQAPKKMIEFINLACPYCRQWFNNSFDLLEEAVGTGKIQRVIKLFDKEKESLQRGNIMHHHVTATDGKKALAEIKKIFDTQDEWKHLSLSEVADYAKNQLGLAEQIDFDTSQAIMNEASEANIQFVPTIILGEAIFDESITHEKLTGLIDVSL